MKILKNHGSNHGQNYGPDHGSNHGHNNFEFDFSPETVTLEELKSHAIELGGVRSEYRKKNRILFQDQVFGNDVSFNDTLLSLDSSLD